MWRVFSTVAPSLNLPSVPVDVWGSNFPFSVKVDVPISVQTIMSLHRDHYEGTQYDLTKGIASGPYGDPSRYDVAPVDNMTTVEAISGSYERAISLFRTSYSMIAQARGDYPNEIGGRIWFSPSTPSAAAYIPLYVISDTIPNYYTHGSLFKYDPSVAYWKFNSVSNYANRFYKFAMVDVKLTINQIENNLFDKTKILDKNALKILEQQNKLLKEKQRLLKLRNDISVDINIIPPFISPSSSSINEKNINLIKLYTNFQNEQANIIMEKFSNLLELLFTKYHDGAIATNLDQPDIVMVKMFYPKWWLNITGYFNNKPNFGPDVLMFQSLSNKSNNINTIYNTYEISLNTCLFLMLLSLISGVYIGYKFIPKIHNNKEYMAIEMI